MNCAKWSPTNDTKVHTRDSNIELLRIVSIFLIIFVHQLSHGLGYNKGNIVANLFFGCFTTPVINAFIFISGYFGLRFKWKIFISLVLQAIFYSIIIYLIGILFFPNISFEIGLFIKSFFPLTTYLWWFISVYMLLYVLSPLINKGLERLNKRQFLIVTLSLLLLNFTLFFSIFLDVSHKNSPIISVCVNFIDFLSVYVLGRYMYANHIYPKKAFLKYFLACMLFIVTIIVFVLAFSNHNDYIGRVFRDNNPLTFLSGIYLFFTFKSMNLKYYRIINNTSPLILGVYMIHDHLYIRELLAKCVNFIYSISLNNTFLYIELIIFSMIVFLIAAGIEKLRRKLFKPVENSIEQYILHRLKFLKKA
ncbi:MAG: acyltransferase family protein [Candidatus Symbiothrix sp.]|jgi:surface polysaccharide O-acyltransferase-like enzyme|nr:acyltransferase family protein [Candidatus Symbiothrix sp.]